MTEMDFNVPPTILLAIVRSMKPDAPIGARHDAMKALFTHFLRAGRTIPGSTLEDVAANALLYVWSFASTREPDETEIDGEELLIRRLQAPE